jgi:hypothetical protein
MMKKGGIKYIFYLISALLLLFMLVAGTEAGITCDEVLHYDHSVSVYNYYASHGKDRSALETGSTHLKYYGQSYDNIVTILIRWLNITDIYRFRHFMSSVAGWLTIMVTAVFAIWLADYSEGILVLLLFAVSPGFIGHSLNNLKDIPFALGYIAAIFCMLKFLSSSGKISVRDLFFLTGSIAFTISIRAGGLILICYLFFFFLLLTLYRYITGKPEYPGTGVKLVLIISISVASWLISILLWPFALQSPVGNVIESYRVMSHFPDTFRQIFEGKSEWSDFMPWYYLPKSMFITIPVVVLAGFIFSAVNFNGAEIHKKAFLYGSLVFTVLFPMIFVIIGKSNLYSSWRQFLFVYPVIVLLASAGLSGIFRKCRTKFLKLSLALLLIVLSTHPVRFMIRNHPYFYLYYNQLVGGLHGAYGNYETDYYYVSQTRASEWLIQYLKSNRPGMPVKVAATFVSGWYFRDHPEIQLSYTRYEERSQSDWDYAIITNRYIAPYQLKNGLWPPADAIHTICADGVPVCAVLERRSGEDFSGYSALCSGKNEEAILHFRNVLKVNDRDDMIFFNFAAALNNTGQHYQADSVLKQGLAVNPYSEPILMYLGNMAASGDRREEAAIYYRKVLGLNRKYFEAYLRLAEMVVEDDIFKARSILRDCLKINPHYKPAIILLADSYRKSNPDIARKYDEMAKTIN